MLTDADREALIDARLDDDARRDGYVVLGPGGTDGNTPTLEQAVESIVAAHVDLAVRLAEEAVRAETLELVDERVAAALNAAADELDRRASGGTALNYAAEIVRSRIT